ncbi:MAG TPA: hypothetical protein VNY27_11520 [Solirubrobacteraceae bacterium]|nr:hypothetical protein [Solirubrobacteraceae bacterium]
MTRTPTPRAAAGLALLCAAMTALAAGCGATSHPGPIGASELAEAQTFPYYRIYWAGLTFQGQPLVAADGRKSYNTSVGDSVYYGDCARGHGVFGGGGSCQLPLQVTTVVYRLHYNAPLGPQRNMLIRGVPATVYDEGRSIELYSGRVAIDIFSDTFARARAAALQLRPLNAAGSATGPLPAPVYCPWLYGAQEPRLQRAMARLPGRACQIAAAEVAFASSLRLATSGSRARADAPARGGG